MNPPVSKGEASRVNRGLTRRVYITPECQRLLKRLARRQRLRVHEALERAVHTALKNDSAESPAHTP